MEKKAAIVLDLKDRRVLEKHHSPNEVAPPLATVTVAKLLFLWFSLVFLRFS
jgi:hypothetical protein